MICSPIAEDGSHPLCGLTRRLPVLSVGAAMIALLAAAPARGTTDLKRGDPAPPLAMQSIDGREIDTAKMRGRVMLLLFGQAGQDKTHLACRDVVAALEAKRLADQSIDWILVLSKSSRIEDLDREAIEVQPPPIIVHDTDRTAFGAYETRVVPTVVVVGRDGRVVHAMAGYTHRFGDIVFDALSVAVGKLSVERFEQTLHPLPDNSIDQRKLRAERLVHFADRLSRRGLDALAEAKYDEALELAPGSRPARLGLGALLLGQQRLNEAEHQYREVLDTDPESLAATLGLAFVFAYRGGVELSNAEKLASELIRRDRSWARAHFLMGLIHEKRGDSAAAAASFKTAAELLLDRLGPEEEASGDSAAGRIGAHPHEEGMHRRGGASLSWRSPPLRDLGMTRPDCVHPDPAASRSHIQFKTRIPI